MNHNYNFKLLKYCNKISFQETLSGVKMSGLSRYLLIICVSILSGKLPGSEFEYPGITEKLLYHLPLREGSGGTTLEVRRNWHLPVNPSQWLPDNNLPSFSLPQNKTAVKTVPSWNHGSFSFELWVKPQPDCDGYVVLKKGSFGMAFRKNGKMTLYLVGEDGCEWTPQFDKYETQRWQHYLVSCDGQSVKVYRNGEAIFFAPRKGSISSSISPLLIGDSAGWGGKFNGELGRIRVFSRAMTSDDIRKCYQSYRNYGAPAEDINCIYDFNPLRNRNFQQAMLQFNGKDESLVINTGENVPGEQSSLSFFAFVKPSAEKRNSVIIDCRNAFRLTIDSGNKLTGYLKTTEGECRAAARLSDLTGKAIWLGMSWNGRFCQLFADGQPVGDLQPLTGKFNFPAGNPIYIGRDSDGKDYFQGAMGDARISSETFSSCIGEMERITLNNDNRDRFKRERSRHLAGMTEKQPPALDFENLDGWAVTSYHGIASGKLYRSGEEPLWGRYAARVELKKGTFQRDTLNKLIVTPPAPVTISESFDTISVWIMPQYKRERSTLMLSFQLCDRNGKTYDIPMKTADYGWLHWSGWTIWNKPLAQEIPGPVRLLSLTFSGINQNIDDLYMDSVYFYRRNQQPLPECRVPDWNSIGIPTTADTILPSVDGSSKTDNRLERVADHYAFSYAGENPALKFVYKPQTGTLSDIRALADGQDFMPMAGGGWQFVNGNASIKSRLIDLRTEGRAIVARWEYDLGKAKTVSEWRLEMKGRTLIVDLKADKGVVNELSLGMVKGLPQPKVVEIPYLALVGWRHKSVDPGVLNSGKLLVSCWLDWYNSAASELFGKRQDVNSDRYVIDTVTSNLKWIEEKNTGTTSKDEAVINGGAAYMEKTDGTRNPPHERIFLTVSDRMADVLPDIPNPPSRYLHETAGRLWSTRCWYVDKYPYPEFFQEELAMWRKLHAYGVENVNIRFHGNLYRMYTPRRSGDPMTFIKDIDPGIGGDAGLKEFFADMKKMNYLVGLYTDHTLLSPLSYECWSEDYLARTSKGEWVYGSDSHFQVKNSRMLELQKKYNAVFREKYAPNCSYLDQLTCPPVWRYTDYDARVPDAGKFSAAYRVFAESLEQESRDFNGPVLSEGQMQWMFSGLCDSYAQPTRPDQPTLPDFQLRKLHLKSNDTGFHLKYTESWEPEQVNRLLAAQIAYGHIGHLYGIFHFAPPKTIPAHLLKSYFMMQQLQKYYSTIPVQEIKYDVNGHLMPVEDAIRAGTLGNNRVYLKYQNGLEVFVNRNSKDSWNVKFSGKSYQLPSEGWFACLPGRIITYSITVDNRRVDLIHGADYTYCNGGGTAYDFGSVTAANPYLLKVIKDTLVVTPAPFQAEENISIDTSDCAALKNAERVKVTCYDINDKMTDSFMADVKNRRLELLIRASGFKYVISL